MHKVQRHLLFTDATTGCTATTLGLIVDPFPAIGVTGPNQICTGSTTTILPSSGGTWSSADNTIATIDNFGTITGIGPGCTTFTFTSASTLCSSEPSDLICVIPSPIVFAPSTSPLV